jgi:quinol monooxygenase YgiN
VRSKEFSTVSYEILQSDKDRLQIFILERYKDKAAYLETHKSSSEFIAFRAKFQTMIDSGTKVDGASYVESGIGFI